MLWRQVLGVIKKLWVSWYAFYRDDFHHHWLLQGAIFMKKIDLKRSRSSASMLSHNTATAPYWVQAIISKSCSSRIHFSLFQHGHPNGWFTTTRQQPSPNPHLAVTALSESTQLFEGLVDTSLEPATTQAWFNFLIMCSLSYDREKNTLKSIENNPERPSCYCITEACCLGSYMCLWLSFFY
jgi:hypothetical protein